MAIKFKCLDCDTVFSEQNAYCEKRQDSQRSFGCPSCKTFYQKPPKKIHSLQFLMAVFLVIPAFFILFRSIDPFNIWGVLFFSVVMIVYIVYIAKQARKTPFQRIEKIES
jgi:Ca2+/Na+ antiporter